jgi:glucose-1-phosphate adenylyltransferase
MLRFHLERKAGATLAVIDVSSEDAHRFGILEVDAEDRLTGFLEKPRGLPAGTHLASMGIYIFDMKVLLPALEADASRASSHDFGKDIIPSLISSVPVYAYRFTDENKKASKYWRDIGTLDAYYEANMDLCRVNPEFNLYDPEWPVRTHQVQAPPAKFVFADEGRRSGQALDSLISAGCIISGSTIRGSVLCPNVRVHSFCRVEDSILMPGVRVGRHAQLRRVIVDRDVFIPRGAQIGYNEEEDRRRHTVTERGIVVVTKDDDPLVVPISEQALRNEAEFDAR